MKDFNKYALDNMRKYKKLKVVWFCLAGVLLLVGIILAALKFKLWIGMLSWGLCLLAYWFGSVVKDLEHSWGKMIQLCPECKSNIIDAHINHKYDNLRQYDRFQCRNCGHEWDNSEILKRLNVSKQDRH